MIVKYPYSYVVACIQYMHIMHNRILAHFPNPEHRAVHRSSLRKIGKREVDEVESFHIGHEF